MTDLELSVSYRPWDREEKLGSPPWSRNDPKLVAWEKAHGHDVRLKCYPEFGCLVVEERAERIEEAAREVVKCAPGYTAKNGSIWALDHALDRLREALDEQG